MRNTESNLRFAFIGFVLAAALGAQAQSWSFTGSMQQARIYPSATLLSNGEVLVVGGYHRGSIVAVAELYNPATGTFTTTGSLNTARYGHNATLLDNGKVLIAGGENTSGALASAELYDPSTGKFSVTGGLACACGRVSTLLPDGTVLFSGGFNGSTAVATAEIYNPAKGTFSATAGNLKVARAGPSSTLLTTGKVLIAGGVFFTGTPPYNLVANYLASAELYDPTTGTFSLTGSLHTARSGNTATVLGNGNVLMAAGENNGANGGYLGSAEIYNPTAGKFTVTGSLNTPRFLHTAHLLASGEVLIVAGNYHGSIASAELYNPATGSFTNTASLNTPRQGHQSVLLTNGQVLAVGGYESQRGSYTGYLASAELYH